MANVMFAPRRLNLSMRQKLARLNWLAVLGLAAITGIGVAMLYSVAGGDMDPWAKRHAMRFLPMLVLMVGLALVDVRAWMTLAYPAYFGGLAMLFAVEVIGVTGMGGQRWLDLKFFQIQPSELMKIALIMALARFYHGQTRAQTRKISRLAVPFLMLALPVVLVIRQPDLGTALMLVAGSLTLIFLAGAPMWLFISGGVAGAAAIPLAWQFLLRDYQKSRVLTFLDPGRDPQGAGYQIMQSKIALGSGGMSGKGYLEGTQSHLNFLPEMKTDFIFTVLGEEFGLVGGAVLVALYCFVLGYGVYVSMTCRNQFGRLLAGGLTMTLFLYVFINIAMVMGLLPVVGVPLPLVSYGGSAMLTLMIAYGLILSVALHRQLTIPRGAGL